MTCQNSVGGGGSDMREFYLEYSEGRVVTWQYPGGGGSDIELYNWNLNPFIFGHNCIIQ